MSSTERNRHYLIDEMEYRYLQRSWTDQELADELGTDRTNVWKIRVRVMEEQMGIPFIKEGHGRYRIDSTYYVSHIHLNQAEALALYLGGRRLQQQTRTGQRDVARALSKLSSALRKPLAEQLTRAAEVILEQEQDERQSRVLQTLLEAWVNNRMVHIKHRKAHGQLRPYTVAPYQLEPSVWGDGIYLIGYSEYHKTIASFKVARIEQATVTTQPFTIPDEFDSHELLQHAWGIWQAEGQKTPVRLRFTPFVTPRVKETIWHPDQTITDLEDGGCIWQAAVAEWREMLPWVRGWGSDVEVLEPADLREGVAKTAVRLNKLYGTLPMTNKHPYQLPYAKTNPDNKEEIHLLLYHLIDVGQVALVMWQNIITNGMRQRLAQILNLDEVQAGCFFAFLAALHDLGKAGPAYQNKYAPDWLKKELEKAGLVLRHRTKYSAKTQDPATSHATVSARVLVDLLPDMLDLKPRFAKKIADALGGHHGAWPNPGATDNIDDTAYPLWDEVRQDIFWELRAVFHPPSNVQAPTDQTELNTFLTVLSGFVSVADWLGSRNKECFGFIEQPMPTRHYAIRAQAKAEQSLSDLGWIGWQPDGRTVSFTEAFAYLPEIKAPRQVQADVIAAAKDVSLPTLMILETTTGGGKTETGVYLADCWIQKHQGRGLYIAMPTQATSNQMYGRIGAFLHHRYPDMRINYHLVHGQAAWLDELKQTVELQSVGDDNQAHVAAESWFTPRKRTLLAPFGVGTVDQTFMSILQTKHFFVRLFGLSHKVVIFDEVHAYDAFMNTIFHRLLEWLSAIGTSVIILSATLPAITRRNMVEAYTGKKLPEMKESETLTYPSLTLASPQQEKPTVIPLTPPPPITLQLNWEIDRDPKEIAGYLHQALVNGGCAAIICNTVRRAQDVYRAIQEVNLAIEDDNLILFHARFPPIWRQGIEQTVLKKFGKGKLGERPYKAVVIATQVIEQSLDLDFDLMITDLAPVDLIIQRAGRLHRHDRGKRLLPRQLFITQPNLNQEGIPEFDKDAFIYEADTLLRSYWILRDKKTISLPADTISLIESVYGQELRLEDLPIYWQEALQSAVKQKTEKERKTQTKAKKQLVPDPGYFRLLTQSNAELEEDDPQTHHTLRVQTRNIDLGISLICLHQTANGLTIYGKEGIIPVSLDVEPSPDLIKQLLQNMITVQNWAIVDHFIEQEPPKTWLKTAALRYCHPIIFIDNVHDQINKYLLRLTPEFGLEITKKEAV